MPRLLPLAALAAIVTLPLLAQAGNETIFVGTSTSGSTDTHAFVASGTGGLLQQADVSFTDNVSDAVWANTGRNLYVSQTLQNQVSRAEWNGSAASWSSFYPAPGACYGLALDRIRQRLWVLTGGSASGRELHCVDADPDSPTYGQLLAQTTSLGGASRERWEMSWSGNLAVVPHVFLNGGLFEIVDTDPGSTSFLQTIVSVPVPGAAATSFAFTSDCAISIDDQYAYVLYTGIGASSGLAVMEIATQTWLDFSAAPGQQDIAIALSTPNTMDLALDRSFAVVSGQGGGGWVLRIDFDYSTPTNTTSMQYLGLSVPNCNAVSLSPDSTRVAVTSTVQSVGPPGTLVIFDAGTGSVLQSVALGTMWNIYTTAWQDASPTATFTPYGAGCAGTLGVPILQAAAGSRPALGATFQAEVLNLPFGLALLGLGLSNAQTSGSLPLPLDLTPLGMSGCTLFADPLVLLALAGAGSSVNWSWNLPSSPSLFGATFFSQAFAFDPPANPFGFTASNAAVGWVGF